MARVLPEKRHGDPGGVGTRGRHGEARRETANAGLALALAGEAPNDGAARTLAAEARRSSGGVLLVDSLRESEGKRFKGMRHDAGRRGDHKRAAGSHSRGRNQRRTAAGPRCSGEQIRQRGRVVCKIGRGELQRKGRALRGMARARINWP